MNKNKNNMYITCKLTKNMPCYDCPIVYLLMGSKMKNKNVGSVNAMKTVLTSVIQHY